MKNIYFLIVTILLTSSFLACSDEEGGDIHMVIKEVHFSPEGGKTDLDPIVSGSFNVVSNHEWIKTHIENGMIILEVSPFFSGAKRIGTIEITNKSSNKIVQIIQFPQSLKIDGNKEAFASFKSGGEYKFSINSTFPEEPTRFRTELKDEADKSWIQATFTSTSEVAVKVSANPTKKPKESIVYLIVDGDVESTIMDSITVKSTYFPEDYVGQWTATFYDRSDNKLSEDIEIAADQNGNLYLKGVSAYPNESVPIDIPFTVGANSFSIPTGRKTPTFKINDEKYIFLLVTTSEFLMWGVGSGPQNYTGKIEFDPNGKPICKFAPFAYSGYTMTGFGFRAFKSIDASGSLGVARYVNKLELKMK